jgi:hypothetical protein
VNVEKVAKELARFSESTGFFGCEVLDYVEVQLGRERKESGSGHKSRLRIGRCGGGGGGGGGGSHILRVYAG